MKQFYKSAMMALSALALTVVVGCSEDPTEDSTPAIPTITLSEIDVESGVEFLYSAANTVSFTLTTDASWEITKSDGWFSVSPKSGEAGEAILITVAAAPNEEEARESSFTITSNSGDNVRKVTAEQVVKVSQEAFGSASIILGGDVNNGAIVFGGDSTEAKSFTVMSTFDWAITPDDGDWYTLSAIEGDANTLATITVTPKSANTSINKREAVLAITATDADFTENTSEETLSLVQLFPADTHAVGYEFFGDDFSWVTENWNDDTPKYGWPTFKVDGNSYNEFGLVTASDPGLLGENGYTSTAPYVYAHYEGCVKFGKTNYMGNMTLPTLSIDDNTGATLLVEFDAALYATAKPTVDSGAGDFSVSVDGDATVGGWVESEQVVDVRNIQSWKRYSVLVYGATKETKITLGSEDKVTRRIYLDNIKVTRADDINPVQPEVSDVVLPIDSEVIDLTDDSTYSDGKVSSDGAELTYSIRVNDGWVATPKVDWINITAVKVGTSTSSIGATIADGVLTAEPTALPYNGVTIEVERSAVEEIRTGTIEVTSRGEVVETITISQEAGSALQLDVDGSLVDFGSYSDVIVLADKDASATYILNGTTAWSLKSKSDWITLSKESGEANTDEEVTITTTADNKGFRRYGEIVFMLSNGVESADFTYVVTQNTVAPGNNLCDINAAPVKWDLQTAKYTTKEYLYDFVGHSSDKTPFFNNIPSTNGAGYISYTHVDESDTDCGRFIGTTGEPYIKGGWKGDSWLFKVYTTGVAAGSKVRFYGVTKASATGLKYWMGEYKDGGEWKPVVTPTSATTLTEGVIEYTHQLIKTDACTLDYTVTLENAVANGGTIEFRFTCQSLDQANGTSTLPAPNTGTSRFCGDGDGTTSPSICPMIEIVNE